MTVHAILVQLASGGGLLRRNAYDGLWSGKNCCHYLSNSVTVTLAGVVALKLAADSFAAGQYYGRGNCLAYALPVYGWLNPTLWAPYELKRGTYNCS